MIDFTTELGVDLSGPTLRADVELDVGFDPDSNDQKHARRLALLERYTPRYIKTPIGVNVPATGAAAQIVSDSPSMGRRVEIRRLYLDLAAPIAANGTVVTEPTTITVFLVADPGNAPLVPFNISAANILWRWNVFPILQAWGSHELPVDYPDNIYLLASNTAGTAVALAGTCQMTDFPDDMFTEPQMTYQVIRSFDGA